MIVYPDELAEILFRYLPILAYQRGGPQAGVVVYASPGAEKQYGYGPNVMIGKHIEELVPVEDRGKQVERQRQLELEPAPDLWFGPTHEVRVLRKDGTTFSATFVLIRCATTRGEPLTVAAVIDETRQVRPA